MKALASALLLVLAAQPESPPPGPAAYGVLKKNCATCHGDGGSKKGGMSYILDRDQLVERGQIVPGDPAKSPLYQRLAKGEMPPAKHPRPTPAEAKSIERWIAELAPAFGPAVAKRDYLTHEAVAAAIAADLQTLPAKQRKFARYFTVAHLLNAGRDEREIETTRLALAKLLNCLSWHARLTTPAAVGAGVYRIDLRDYKWSASTWERLVRDYPYKVAWGHSIAKATGAEFAALRADWFVASASRAPLYYDLLQMPVTDRALERLLQVDVVQNLQDENAIRAGFNDSGVSKNNRILERHDAVYGAYWRSYDFDDNKGRQSIFEHPLGPTNGENSFKQAGGEMIFHLPNGLHGYLIVDAKGRRIDKAPVEVVADPLRPDHRVEAGLSCMSCHARGYLPKADQVRAHVLKNKRAFQPADVETVAALFAPREKFDKVLEEDNAKVARALGTLGVHLDTDDPVNVVTRRYEGPLDFTAAVAELGVSTAAFRKMLDARPQPTKAVAALAAKGGTVTRDAFEEAFAALAAFAPPGAQPSSGQPSFAPTAYTAAGVTHCLAVSKDATLGAAGQDDNKLIVFDIASGKVLASLAGHKGEVAAVSFSPRAVWLASGSGDRTVRTWNPATGEAVAVLVGHTDRVRCLAFSPDGWLLASGGDDRCLRLWDHQRGKEVRSLSGHDGAVLALAWSPDGKSLVTACQDGKLRRWNVATGKLLKVFDGHTGAVLAVAVSPEGKSLLSGGADKTVRLWDAATGKELRRFDGHANSVVAVAFSGKKVLSASSQYRLTDALLRQWELGTGKEDQRWAGEFSGSVQCAVFDPAGRFALSGGTTLKQWILE